MEIKTKFNINDEVWFIDMEHDKWFIFTDHTHKIKAIEISVVEGNYYEVEYIGFYYMREEDCFATKEQAQAECDKRNKGEQQ